MIPTLQSILKIICTDKVIENDFRWLTTQTNKIIIIKKNYYTCYKYDKACMIFKSIKITQQDTSRRSVGLSEVY
jgi:hypothetical protein